MDVEYTRIVARRAFLVMILATVTSILLFPSLLQNNQAAAESVTVPIAINMRKDSSPPEVAGASFTISCVGGGGKHDGNPPIQNFTCEDNAKVIVSVPSDTRTSRFRFSDDTISKSFTSCNSGTCSLTPYSEVMRQVLVTPAVTGLDSEFSTKVTRSQNRIIGVESYQGPGDHDIKFDGKTEYAQAANNTIFDVTTENFSIWGMFKRTFDSGSQELIIKKLGNDHGYRVVIAQNDHLFTSLQEGTDQAEIESNARISLNVWYIWGISADRNGFLSQWLYDMNTGELETKRVEMKTVASMSNEAKFTVATTPRANYGFFSGQMDNLNFRLGAAISEEQFVEFTVKGSIEAITPTSAYLFNEGSGSNATDSFGSNNLTLFNTPTWQSKVWADQASRVTLPSSVSIPDSAETYVANSPTSYFVTNASSPTISYQTEEVLVQAVGYTPFVIGGGIAGAGIILISILRRNRRV